MGVPRVLIDVGLTGPTLGTELVLGDPTRGLLGTGTLGTDDVWVEVTDYVRSWSLRRGASQGDGPTLRYEAGTCSIELNNADRRFDPTNLSGPYVSSGVSSIVPMVRVRIRVLHDGITYPMFYGFADAWQLNYQSPSWSTVILTASDATKFFAAYDRTEGMIAVGAGEDSGARITRILNGVDWDITDREISVGDTDLQATTMSGNTLTELQLVQDTERGDFFISAAGKVVFRNRRAILTRPTSAVAQAVFGDGGYIRPVLYDFEYDPAAGVAGFNATDCTIAATAVRSYAGSQSMLMTVVGSPTQAYARQNVDAPVITGRRYRVGFWAYTPVTRNVTAAIDWGQDGSYLSTTSGSVSVPADTWTYRSVEGTAPALANGAHFGPTLAGSPTAGSVLYVDVLTFEDLNNELPYADVTVETDDQSMANLVTIAREGGTAQTVEDGGSRTRYLTKTYQRLDLLHQTDEESLAYGQWILYQSSQPELRFGTLTLNRPRPEVESLLWPQMIGRDFGDRITVIRRPPGGGDPIELDVFIRGIEASSDGQSWRTAYTLQSADKYSFLVLGDPVYGVLGENALGF